MKNKIFEKQTIKKLTSDHDVVKFLFIALAVVIFLSLAHSLYKTITDDSALLNIVPIALIPILILLGLKRYRIKKEIELRRGKF